MTLSPAGQAAVDAADVQRRARYHAGVRIDPLPGHQVDLSLIDVGWEVWSASRSYADTGAPLGGVVVDIVTHRIVDDETAELSEIVMLRTVDPTRRLETVGSRTAIPLEDVDLTRMAFPGVNRSGAVIAVRKLLAPVASADQRSFTASELGLLDDAWALIKAVRL